MIHHCGKSLHVMGGLRCAPHAPTSTYFFSKQTGVAPWAVAGPSKYFNSYCCGSHNSISNVGTTQYSEQNHNPKEKNSNRKKTRGLNSHEPFSESDFPSIIGPVPGLSSSFRAGGGCGGFALHAHYDRYYSGVDRLMGTMAEGPGGGGALLYTHLPYASPEKITEVAPGATVTLALV
jgi:hypothetical protein